VGRERGGGATLFLPLPSSVTRNAVLSFALSYRFRGALSPIYGSDPATTSSPRTGRDSAKWTAYIGSILRGASTYCCTGGVGGASELFSAMSR